MKHATETFTPAEGVTIDNALEYLQAIENAIRCGITRLPISERSMMLGILSGSIAQTAEALNQFRKDMEKTGTATPATEEQKLQLRMMIRMAAAKNKPEN